MDVALLVLPIVGGCFFAIKWIPTRYSSAREDGHRLYFRAVFSGAVIFSAIYSLHGLSYLYFLPYHDIVISIAKLAEPLFLNNKITSSPIHLAIVSLGSMILANRIAITLNYFFDENEYLKKSIEFNDFEMLIDKAARYNITVCINLENGKVYVGLITTTIDPRQNRRSLRIWPYMSGYRNTGSGRVHFTTFYNNSLR